MNHARMARLIMAADEAYEAIRYLNHKTITTTVPAPVAYDLLGSLRQLQDGVSQFAGQLGSGLRRSLSDYNMYDDARDPAESVGMAGAALAKTATHANRAAEYAAAAQIAITWQGFRLDKEEDQ